MEKRTIIALALSLLILLAWSYFFAPKEEQAPPKVDQPKQAVAPQPKEVTGPGPSAPAVQPQAKEEPVSAPGVTEPEKEVTVQTPLYVAVFSTRGPAIKSFKLKNYHVTSDPSSPFVELANLEKSQESLLKIYFDQQAIPGLEKMTFRVNSDSLSLDAGSPPKDLIFTTATPHGLTVQETVRIYPDKYPLDLVLTVSNSTDKPAEGNFKALIKNIPPKDKSSYYSFIGVSLLLNDKLEEIDRKDTEKGKNLSGKVGWIAYQDDYFMTAVVPENASAASFTGRSLQEGMLEAAYISPPAGVAVHNSQAARFTLYLGPRDLSILKELGNSLDLAVNFGWTDIIAKPLLYALRFFNQYVHNYGIAIILLTVLIKILFWPLTHKSYKSMKEMQKLQPLMAKLREKYKNNKEQMNKELMALYKTYKVNPMGGCLPMIIQIPVFFALFRILGSSIELRHAPFMLWITDLSAPDRLFHFPFEIPFMSPPSGIPVLTLLMGVSMYFQQKMTPTPGDPTQAKIMMLLPLVFTVMFINFPSGLVLYWLINNILSIGQQYRIIKRSA